MVPQPWQTPLPLMPGIATHLFQRANVGEAVATPVDPVLAGRHEVWLSFAPAELHHKVGEPGCRQRLAAAEHAT